MALPDGVEHCIASSFPPDPGAMRLSLYKSMGSATSVESILSLFQNLKSTCKLVILIRHGEGLHNLTKKVVGSDVWYQKESFKEKYLDSPLTETGKKQAQAILNIFQDIGQHVELVLLSPLTRAIQTALLGVLPVVNRHANRVVLEYARESKFVSKKIN